MSKTALAHLTRTLDVELRPSRIRVNALVPQLIATTTNKTLFSPDLLAGAVDPATLAEVIAFLVGDAAAISGALVPACGG